jgi:hypothetical protein
MTDAELWDADLSPCEHVISHLSGPSPALPGPAPCVACGRIDCTTPEVCGMRLSVTVLAVCPTCRGRRATAHADGWRTCHACNGQGLYLPEHVDVGAEDPVLIVTPRPRTDRPSPRSGLEAAS